jgi:hypothetical protein
MFEKVDEAVRASNAALADVLREVARVDADGSWAGKERLRRRPGCAAGIA